MYHGAELLLEGTLRVGYVRVMELRTLNGKVRELRLSARGRHLALHCGSVAARQVGCALGGGPHQGAAGLRACALPRAAGDGPSGRDGLRDGARVAGCGAELRAATLSEELFAAAAMVRVAKDLLAMKVTELRDELKARGANQSGNKAWRRRRLLAAIVRAHLAAEDAEGWARLLAGGGVALRTALLEPFRGCGRVRQVLDI